MTGALLTFSMLAVSFRMLAATLSVIEILAIRCAGGLLVMLALVLVRAELRAAIRTRHPVLHLVRNTVHLGAQYLWATSLLLLPLATVFALEFTGPAWALILALILLRERMTASRVGAVVLGLIGVLVILRPGLQTFQPAALLVLAAAVGLAATLVMTKMLTRTETTFAIVFWMNVIQFPLAMIGAGPSLFAKLTVEQIPAALAAGFAGLASHYCLAQAFRAGDATVVVPLDFLRIPLIAVVGWLLYGEQVDIFVFVGAGVIIAGILWNLRSEATHSPGSRVARGQSPPQDAPSGSN